jgi:antitoxin ParD1/3/4
VASSEQSINLTEAAIAFARELVETGQYPDIATAVSEEMIKARGAREHEHALHRAETQLRRTAYWDTWEPVSVIDRFPASDRAQ